MFNSREVNNDPKPHYVPSEDVRVSTPFVISDDELTEYRPRPEFDNNPNPILEYFRDAIASNEYETVALATIWESLIDTGYDWEKDGLAPTLEELDHARKVLEKMVNVYG